MILDFLPASGAGCLCLLASVWGLYPCHAFLHVDSYRSSRAIWRQRPSLSSPSPTDGNKRILEGYAPSSSFTASASSDDPAPWHPDDWSSALLTQPLETLDGPLVVTDTRGAIPPSFPRGVLYKAGPARFENEGSGTAYAHWLEGDGAISRLELDPERPTEAKFSFRYVETELYRREREEGRILARGTFGTGKDEGLDAFDLTLKNPCNTHTVKIGGEGEAGEGTVLALSEVGLPSRLDPLTLRTTGTETFGGRLREGAPAASVGIGPAVDAALGFGDAVCAHYRPAPSLNGDSDGDGDDQGREAPRLVFASLRQNALTSATILRLFEVDPTTGHVASETRSILEGTGFPPHDWVITEHCAAFVSTPAGGNLTPYILGRKGPAECISFRRGETASVYLVPRGNGGEKDSTSSHPGDGAAVAREVESIQIKLPAALHPVHFANAWERSSRETNGATDPAPPAVEILATCWDDATVRRMAEGGEALLGSWARVRGGDFRGVPVQRLTRIVAGGDEDPKVEEAVPGLGQVDYVKCHPDKTGRPSRFVWGTLAPPPTDGRPAPMAPPQAFCRLDLKRREKVDMWFAGPRRFVDDFVLIAKPEASGVLSSEDDDGESRAWLLAPVFDAERKASSFVLLDGDDLTAGPVFEARLDRHIPWGLHGFWSAFG